MAELDKIIDEFGLPESPRTRTIPKEKVIEWMRSDDIETLGAIYTYIMDGKYADRIDPGLTFVEYYQFVMKYYKRCILENPDGNWSDSRYGAARDLAGWFSGLWEDKSVPRKALVDLKNFLGDLYLSGSKEIKTCIVNGTLEHLFENKKIKYYFSDWKEDIRLSVAYKEAILWQQAPKK